MASETPWLKLRIHIETPTGEAVSLGPINIHGMGSNGEPLIVEVPVYGQAFLADGWPADPAAFAEAVRKARMARKWSQAALARVTKLTEVTVRNLERGKAPPAPLTRAALVAALQRPQQPKENSE